MTLSLADECQKIGCSSNELINLKGAGDLILLILPVCPWELLPNFVVNLTIALGKGMDD